MCRLVKIREAIKINITDLCAIANFNEYANSAESIKIIKQTKAIVAVLDKKDNMNIRNSFVFLLTLYCYP